MDYDNIALVNEREANSVPRSSRSFAVVPSKATCRSYDSDTPIEGLIPLNGSAPAERDGFEGIVGCSQALSEVLQQVREVAPTDSTVLIEGETGTGKELIARAIRAHSRRRTDAFVKMNCAAIPRELLESEIFGHEKGAFTGAVARKIVSFRQGCVTVGDQG